MFPFTTSLTRLTLALVVVLSFAAVAPAQTNPCEIDDCLLDYSDYDSMVPETRFRYPDGLNNTVVWTVEFDPALWDTNGNGLVDPGEEDLNNDGSVDATDDVNNDGQVDVHDTFVNIRVNKRNVIWDRQARIVDVPQPGGGSIPMAADHGVLWVQLDVNTQPEVLTLDNFTNFTIIYANPIGTEQIILHTRPYQMLQADWEKANELCEDLVLSVDHDFLGNPVVAQITSPFQPIPRPTPFLGDANGDGSANIADPIFVLTHLFDPASASPPATPADFILRSPDDLDWNEATPATHFVRRLLLEKTRTYEDFYLPDWDLVAEFHTAFINSASLDASAQQSAAALGLTLSGVITAGETAWTRDSFAGGTAQLLSIPPAGGPATGPASVPADMSERHGVVAFRIVQAGDLCP